MNKAAGTPFLHYLSHGLAQGGFEVDDYLPAILPLFKQVVDWHEAGQVALFRGAQGLIIADDGCIALPIDSFARPQRNLVKIDALSRPRGRGVEIAGEMNRIADPSTGEDKREKLDVVDANAEIVRPVFIVGYTCWEQQVEHHDPLTDIFSLGLFLGSLACGLDFTDSQQLRNFVDHRTNLFALRSRLHPVIARVIVQMTELDRHRRAQDLRQLTRTLENYREQPIEFEPLTNRDGDKADRRKFIQERLRDRLFEISRRNRLLHFKPTLRTLNLTLASVPLVMDLRNIKLDQLFIWQGELASKLSSGNSILLGKYLRVEDALYIPGVLDKIISEARSDRAEYGFAQLRLVLCFLRWNNLKEEVNERIHSPLLLLPVELTKRKGVRDAYLLTPSSTDAEINPALRHHLKTLYGIQLPESIDLSEITLTEFHTDLRAQIAKSEPGVTLEKVEQPRIDLVHARARQRLDQWKQRQRNRVPNTVSAEVDYSYERENFHPKGLALFLDKIKPQPLPMAHLVGAPPPPRLPGWGPKESESKDGPTVEAQTEMYALREGETGNPYHWIFDLCNLTLGNFHYRKMTLVRDYAKLADGDHENAAFDAVFSLDPKPIGSETRVPLPLREQFPVIPCDAAQSAAVAFAREGRSLIIQGPPGTGKSQTITNLIADYVARGKRVLFVCEKRAAIDVVFYRLRQQGLDELCCLIHDSQEDKKAFIQNLKQTYDLWQTVAADIDVEERRARVIAALENDLVALNRFSTAMTDVRAEAGLPHRALLHRRVELKEKTPRLTELEAERLPFYRIWRSEGGVVDRLLQALLRVGGSRVFAESPFRWLSSSVIQCPRPLERIDQLLGELEPKLKAIEAGLASTGLPPEARDSFSEIDLILDYAFQLQDLAVRDQLQLLDGQTTLSKELQTQFEVVTAAESRLNRAKSEAAQWTNPLSPEDTLSALEAARGYDKSVTRFLSLGFWKLRKTVRRRYGFDQHAVEPSLTQVLETLQNEQNARANWDAARAEFGRRFGREPTSELLTFLSDIRGVSKPSPKVVTQLRRLFLDTPNANALVSGLVALREEYRAFKEVVKALVDASESLGLAGLRRLHRELRDEVHTLPELLPSLIELCTASLELNDAVRKVSFPLDQFEAAVAEKTSHDFDRRDAGIARFDGRQLQGLQERMGESRADWLKENGAMIRHQVRRRFREHVALSNLPAAQLTEEQKIFKKTYSSGRRELEHEFGKTMRFKSIRELAAGASGHVVGDLKPIWLMSPLSVSDTLPLDSDLFDVVIYDEASQIPVEEAVPAMFRARQVVVVGDEMQLPPTSFFGTRKEGFDQDEDEQLEPVEVDLEADSFLAQAARNLSSTLLAWHYRSRYENLISFSNAAFYRGNLYTIPDRALPPKECSALVIKETAQATSNVDALLARSISFHFLENAIYEQRRNSNEAEYIAETVRALLRRQTKLSIGIVAFSEAQQGEIERAIADLADEDKEFAARYEEEMVREENDQFCGLFVKNLENVQGDERDIILLSICYGRDRSGRMLMNFGPINQRGGEKRLNVIFSRARHHMAVVTSIRHQDITNEYNDGANALRNFLRFSEQLSQGDLAGARAVLENLNPLNRAALAPTTTRDAVVEDLSRALRERGHDVDLSVGQSRFRCDLAVRAKDQAAYALGVLVDTEEHYANRDLFDRYITRPDIMKTFGWSILIVLTKDWLDAPNDVIERIERGQRSNSVSSYSGVSSSDQSGVDSPPPV